MKFTTWLYRIIANRCLDFLKSKTGRQQKYLVGIKESHSLSTRESADRQVQTQELMIAIQETAATLTPKQRTVFVLRDLEDLSVEEVCQILSMSASKVKSNLYYARKAMSEKLKEYYQTNHPVTL